MESYFIEQNYLASLNFSNFTNESHLYLYEHSKYGHTGSLKEWIPMLNKITTIVLYIEMVFCFTLNCISLTCIFYRKSFTSINILVINLGVADLIYACGIPFYVRQFSNSKTLTQSILGCRLSFLLDITSMIVSKFETKTFIFSLNINEDI